MSEQNKTEVTVDDSLVMNKGSLTDKITTYFSPNQLALALAVQKSKPSELSIAGR